MHFSVEYILVPSCSSQMIGNGIIAEIYFWWINIQSWITLGNYSKKLKLRAVELLLQEWNVSRNSSDLFSKIPSFSPLVGPDCASPKS